jgi:hypothetical protein
MPRETSQWERTRGERNLDPITCTRSPRCRVQRCAVSTDQRRSTANQSAPCLTAVESNAFPAFID